MNGQIRLGAARNIVNVYVAAVLRSSWNGSGAFLGNFGLDVVCGRAGVHVGRVGRLGDNLARVRCGARRDEVALSAVPFSQHFWRRRTAQNTWVDQAGEAHAGDVAAGTVYAVKVPNGLGRLGVVLLEETTTVVAIKDTSEAPGRVIKRLHIGNVDNKKIARLSALDIKGPGQVVDFGQVDIANVVGTVVVANLPASPVNTFNLDRLAGLNAADSGDCRANGKGYSQWQNMLVWVVNDGRPLASSKSRLTVWMPAVVEVWLLRGGRFNGDCLGGANLARHDGGGR